MEETSEGDSLCCDLVEFKSSERLLCVPCISTSSGGPQSFFVLL
jgi:hypothetical protein